MSESNDENDDTKTVVDARKKFLTRGSKAGQRRLCTPEERQALTQQQCPEQLMGEDDDLGAFIECILPSAPTFSLEEYRASNGARKVRIIDGQSYEEISPEEFLGIIDAHDEDDPPSPEHFS